MLNLNQSMAKIAICVSVAGTVCLPRVAAKADALREVLHCTGTLLGAPSYTVYHVDPDEGAIHYLLAKQPNNPMYGPYTVSVASSSVVDYGNAFILTLDRGRSGYAHLYDHGDTTVVDIDLYGFAEMNTDGPQTGYSCAYQGLITPGSGYQKP